MQRSAPKNATSTIKITAGLLRDEQKKQARLLAKDQTIRMSDCYTPTVQAESQQIQEIPLGLKMVDHNGLPLFTLIDIFNRKFEPADKSNNPSKSFHEVKTLVDAETNKTYFYKTMRNPTNPNPMMYEVEAANGHLFKLFAPDCVPKSWAVYDSKSKCYTGVLVKGLVGFQPISKSPLTEELLQLDILKHSHIENWRMQLKRDQTALSKKNLLFSNRAKIIPFNSSIVLYTQPESTEPKAFNCELFLHNAVIPQVLYSLNRYIKTLDDDSIKQLKKRPTDVHYHDLTIHIELKHPNDSKETLVLTVPVTIKDILNFPIVRQNCQTLVGGTGFADDDDHRGNRDKYGRRIDFDMLLRFITYRIKENSLLDQIFRTPSETTFDYSARDVRNFPALHDAAPFHQATRKASKLVDSTLSLLRSWQINLSVNFFTVEENNLYSQLNSNTAFNFSYWDDFFRLCFFTKHLVYPIFASHIGSNRNLENKNLVSLMTDALNAHTLRGQNRLCEMPEFYTFLTLRSAAALNEMIDEFEKSNEKYHNLLPQDERFGLLIINIEKVKDEYQSLCAKSAGKILELELAQNPELMPQKFIYLLKYILLTSKMLRFLPEFRADTTFKYIRFDNILREEWRTHFKNELLKLPDFRKFLQCHGESAISRITQEWREWNQQIAPLPWKNLQFDLADLNRDFNLIRDLARSYCAPVSFMK